MSDLIPPGYIHAMMLQFPCPNTPTLYVSDCVMAGRRACSVCQNVAPPPSSPLEARHEGKGADTNE